MSSRRVYSSVGSESLARDVQKTLLLQVAGEFTQAECLFIFEIAKLRPPAGASLATLRTCAAEIIDREKIDPLKLEFEGI